MYRWSAPAAGHFQQKLQIAKVAFLEPSLAVTQVVVPQAKQPGAVAEGQDVVGARAESFPPCGQRSCVVGTDVLEMTKAQLL